MRDQTLRRSGERTGEAPGETDSVRLKLQEAQEDLDTTRASLAAAEKAAVDAEKVLQRYGPCSECA